MRNRSSAVAITTNTKKRLSQEINENENLSEKEKQIKFYEIFENKLKQENKIKPFKPFVNNNILDIPPPHYLDIKKEYITKDEKAFIYFLNISQYYFMKNQK